MTSRLRAIGFAAVLAVALARAAGDAWVGEDAFITFRVIDNAVNGYGLRWNVTERVQVFTHPAWLILNAGAYALTREVANTTTAIAFACTALAVALLAIGAARAPASRTRVGALFEPTVLALAWLASPTLARYATSGFETSLTLLLVSLFAVALARDPSARSLTLASLAASLGALDRLDLVVLFAPPLALAALRVPARARARSLAIGALPLAAWLAFAVVYYGSALPNTAPAKLAAGVPRSFFVREGLRYVADFAARDPAGAAIVLLAVAGASLGLLTARDAPERAKARERASLAAGACAYALYVVYVGGDFLSGRFFVPSLWASAIVLAGSFDAFERGFGGAQRGRIAPLAASAAAAVAIAAAFALAARSAAQTPAAGPIHERSLARLELGLDGRWSGTPMARVFAERGEALRARAEQSGEPVVAVLGEVGFAGFAAGPRVEIVDPHALTDAFLAHCPPDPSQPWRIGHLPRAVPPGYLDARASGDASTLAPALRAHFDRSALLARAPLASAERWRAILAVGGARARCGDGV